MPPKTHWKNSLTSRALLLIALAVGLVIIVAMTITYQMVFRAAEQRGQIHLNQYTTERAGRLESYCAEIVRNLETARDAYVERYKAPDPPGYLDLWDRYFEKTPKGAWVSRREYSNDYEYAPLWAHQDVGPSPGFKRRILVMFDVCRKFLPGWVRGFRSLYGFTNDEMAVIGFDPALSGWIYDQEPDYDINKEEFGYIGTREGNPSRQIAWTGTTSDASSGHSLVSVVLPVELDGRYLISVAHDMWVDDLIAETTRAQIPGLTHMIFRQDGRMIAYPDRANEIFSGKGQLNMATAGDPVLSSLYKAVANRTEFVFGGYDSASGNYYSVHRIAGPGWFYLTRMPRSMLSEQAFDSAKWILWSALGSLALELLLLGVILRRSIEAPIGEFVDATRRIASGDSPIHLPTHRHDELGLLSRAFREMAENVRERDDALRREKESLEQRVAERTAELARFARILDLTPDFVGICDMQERVVYLNRAGRQLIQLAPDATYDGLTVRNFHPEWAYNVIRNDAMPHAAKEGLWTGTVAMRDHSGREIPVSSVCIVLKDTDGTPRFGATIMRDLSDSQRVQHELERTLEREREVSDLRANFVSLVSHEFRTPLEVILTSSDILDRYFERLDPARRKTYLRTIHDSVKRMGSMMEDVLLLGRVEEGRLQFRPDPIDLAAFCRRMTDEMHSATMHKCPIRLRMEGSLSEARADESLVRHIIANLLSNASKYSPQGTPVEFSISRDGDDAVIAVADRGRGIPAADRERLFQSFQRGSNVSDTPGTGLGLMIVKKCVEIHGGSIAIESEEDRGATFTVRLPLFAAPELNSAPPEST